MGPANAIIGNESMPTNSDGAQVPAASEDDTQLNELRKAAKFAKSAEYNELKEYLVSRVDFYQTFLPDGRAVGAQIGTNKLAEIGRMWTAANVIIAEFRAIISRYEQAEALLNGQSNPR